MLTPQMLEARNDYFPSPAPSVGQSQQAYSLPPRSSSVSSSPSGQIDSLGAPRSGMSTSSSLLLPSTSVPHPGLPRRKSAEEVEREQTLGLGLGVPPRTTSRAERRRSINPMSFPVDVEAAVNGPRSPDRQGHEGEVTSPTEGRSTPLPPSPLRSSFSTKPQSSSRDGSASPSSSPLASSFISSSRRPSSRDSREGEGSNSSTPTGNRLPASHSSQQGSKAAEDVLPDRTAAHSQSSDRGPPSINVRPSSQSSSKSYNSLHSPKRSSSVSSAMSFPSSPSLSSERSTNPTISVSPSPPRTRSISAIGNEAPRLDAHRPVSFLLSEDPEFSKLFDGAVPRHQQQDLEIDPLGQPVDVVVRSSPSVQRLREGSEDSTSTDVPESPDYFEDLQTLPVGSAGLRVRRDSENSVFAGQNEVGESFKALSDSLKEAKEGGQETLQVKVKPLEEVLGAFSRGQERCASLKEKYDGVRVRLVLTAVLVHRSLD